MKDQRGSAHLPIILALFFGAAVVVTIFGYMLWPKDEEIATNTSIDTNKVVNVSTGTSALVPAPGFESVDESVVKSTSNINTDPLGFTITDNGSVSKDDALLDEEPTNQDQADESGKNPIRKVADITAQFPNSPDEGFRRVNVMDDKALIAGGRYLYYYDGSAVTDLSEKLRSADPTVDAKMLVPGGIANNGNYWMIGNTRVGETVHLYTYDGTTWKDLTSELLSAVPNTITGGLNFAWNGSYWLIGHNPGHLVKYDGKTFTDLYSQIPNPEGNVTFMDIDWNGSYFMFVMLGPGNHGRVYRYDGKTFTRVSEVSTDSYVTTLAWNGSYWLISGFNGQHLLKYDAKTLVDLGVGTRHQAMTAWVKTHWLISGYLFDGKILDQVPTVLGGFDLSVGKHYGIALNYKYVQRFDF